MVCKKCKKELSSEMIKANLCWNCGEIIDKNLTDADTNYDDIEIETEYSTEEDIIFNNTNSIAKSIRIFAKIIMIVGSILNVLVLFVASGYYTFTSFLAFEMMFILFGLLLLGFSEIIQLLQDIKSNLIIRKQY